MNDGLCNTMSTKYMHRAHIQLISRNSDKINSAVRNSGVINSDVIQIYSRLVGVQLPISI